MPSSPSTGYRAIADALLTEIRDGKYQPGHQFPSLTAIMRRFGVTRITAKRAVDDLKRRGAVRVEPRSGTVVRNVNRTIGLVILSESPLFQSICAALSVLCQRGGYSLLLGVVTEGAPEERAAQARELADRFSALGVAGVILQPIGYLPDADERNAEIAARFRKSRIPVVLLDGDIVPMPEASGLDVVEIDNFEAGYTLTRHILSQRPGATVTLLRPSAGTHAGELRRSGIRQALLDGGGTFAELTCNPGDTTAFRRHLRRDHPNAIICAHDAMAIIAATTLRALKKRVPEDILLASFDDIPAAAAMTPSLTTIRQPADQIARASFDTLLRRIANPGISPHRVLVHAPLVARQSTGVLPET